MDQLYCRDERRAATKLSKIISGNKTGQIFKWKHTVLPSALPASRFHLQTVERWHAGGGGEQGIPKCACDKANISPRRHFQKLCSLWKCHTFNLERTPALPQVTHCVLQQLLFQTITGHSSPTAAPTYIKMCVCVCVCRDFRAGVNYSTVVGFSQMKVKADHHLLHHSVPSVNPSMQQGGINYSSFLLCGRYMEAFRFPSQPLYHSSPLRSHGQPPTLSANISRQNFTIRDLSCEAFVIFCACQ